MVNQQYKSIEDMILSFCYDEKLRLCLCCYASGDASILEARIVNSETYHYNRTF